MTNEANDIIKQAKQGSVAAVIQVLNEKLADSGVRTRAIFADGVLQLLCEAPTLEQLEQPVLVERIRYLLEEISPRNIRRVNINSRIVREQQLLWLEEISRDPENQLVWSEEITLKRPSFLQQLQADWANRETDTNRSELSKAIPPKIALRKKQERQQFWKGIIGGAIASCLLLAGGWWLYDRFIANPTSSVTASTPPASDPSAPASPAPGATSDDPFATAVRLAEKTSADGKAAQTSADWLQLASQWQKASDLMAQVDTTDSRYTLAQTRVALYRQNSEAALEKAQSTQ